GAANNFVYPPHQVLIVLNPPTSPAGVREFMTVAGRATGVGEEDPVTLSGEHLKFVEVDVAVLRVRSAVNVEGQRKTLPDLKTNRLHQPTLNPQPPDARVPQGVGWNHCGRSQKPIVERREAPLCGSVGRGYE